MSNHSNFHLGRESITAFLPLNRGCCCVILPLKPGKRIRHFVVLVVFSPISGLLANEMHQNIHVGVSQCNMGFYQTQSNRAVMADDNYSGGSSEVSEGSDR